MNQDVDQLNETPIYLRFRHHVIPPVVMALLATGNPLGIFSVPIDSVILGVLSTEYFLWSHPLNWMFSVFVLIAIPVLEIRKAQKFGDGLTNRKLQIGIWWTYWTMIALAMGFGTYRGP